MLRDVCRWTFAIAPFLQFALTQSISCSVTREGKSTTYRIPEFNGANCLYQWVNSTDYVIANNAEKADDQVVMMNSTTLTIYGCSEEMKYQRDCISEGKPRMTNCTTNCSGNVDTLVNGPGTLSVSWIAAIAVLVAVLLVACALCCFAGSFYKKKKKPVDNTDPFSLL